MEEYETEREARLHRNKECPDGGLVVAVLKEKGKKKIERVEWVEEEMVHAVCDECGERTRKYWRVERRGQNSYYCDECMEKRLRG